MFPEPSEPAMAPDVRWWHAGSGAEQLLTAAAAELHAAVLRVSERPLVLPATIRKLFPKPCGARNDRMRPLLAPVRNGWLSVSAAGATQRRRASW